jgi:hypothetical protein
MWPNGPEAWMTISNYDEMIDFAMLSLRRSISMSFWEWERPEVEQGTCRMGDPEDRNPRPQGARTGRPRSDGADQMDLIEDKLFEPHPEMQERQSSRQG